LIAETKVMSAVPIQAVEMREARFQDYNAIAALESSQGLASKPAEEWRRLWNGNPCYEEIGPRWPIGWVLEEAERIVGCFTNIPLAYSFRGRKLLAAAGRGWTVEDKYRGYASLLMNEYFGQENVDLFLTNTVNGNAANAFSTLGSLRVPTGDWHSAAFAITAHRGFAESALRIKGVPLAGLLSYPAGLALAIKDRLTAKPIPVSNIDISLNRDFDQRFDIFWEVLHNRSEALVADRSRDVLKWHFAASIDNNQLWVITASRNGNLDAYAVFQRRDEPRYGLTRMRMVDFQACDWHDEYCAAMMQRAYDECRKQGIHVLEQVGCDLEKTRIFDQSAPYRRKLPSWSFFYSTKNEQLAGLLAEPSAWEPSSYDADASL
jgi:hypothetical protein